MIICAPNQSPSHQELRRLARSAAEEGALREFLWLTNAHCDLVALPLICHNLRIILAAAEQEWDIAPDEWFIADRENTLRWIEDDRRKLQGAIQGKFDVGFEQGGNHPLMRSGIERYPVYATICNSHEKEEMKSQYRLLQAHLLVAHAHAMRRFTTRDEYESHGGKEELLRSQANPYLAALAIRDLSRSNREGLLESLPVDLPPLEFLTALPEIALDSKSDIRRYRDLAVFLEKALGDRKQGHRSPNSGGRRGAGPQIHGNGDSNLYLEEELEFGDPDEHNAVTVTIRKQIRTTRQEIRACLADDVCPFEDLEDEELDDIHFADKEFEKNPGTFQQAAVTYSHHVAMANQMLPWAYGRLTVPELRKLLNDEPARMRTLLAGPCLALPDLEKLEILALVHVMFWTGSSVGRARRLMHFRKRTSKEIDLALILGDELPSWRVRAPLHDFGMSKQEVAAGTDRSRTEFLELPDVVDGSYWVREFLLQRGRQEGAESGAAELSIKGSARVFRKRKQWYEEQLRKLLSICGSESRVTKSRVANVIFHRVMVAAKGDLTAAAIITGQQLSLARVRLFYACPSVRRLQKIYTEAAGEIYRELGNLAGFDATLRTPIGLDSDERYICNRVCPTVSTLRSAVRRMHEELNRHRCYSSRDGFREYHNLLTLYTCVLFSYVTGVRGIRTPYLPLSSVDPVHGFAKLIDKDSGTGYKTRLAWVMPMLREQMEFYQDFVGRRPNLPASTDLPVYFLDENMKPLEVRPKTSLPLLQRFLLFPINIHRRFISAELLDRGCPPEVVDAWAGHWYRGEEPWSRFSVFSFKEHKQALEKYLVPLLVNEIGFRAVKGFSQVRFRQ